MIKNRKELDWEERGIQFETCSFKLVKKRNTKVVKGSRIGWKYNMRTSVRGQKRNRDLE